MFFYLLLALLTVVASYLGLTSSTKRTKEVSLLVAWIAFLLIVGLRYHHGDYGTYEMGYKYDQDVGGDFGYFALQKIFHRMGAPFWFFAFLITLLSVYCFKKIFSISPWPAFGLTMIFGKIFTLYAMSGIRQYLAMAICWWALYQLLVKKRDWVFWCSVFLAYTMHASALIFIPVYFFRNMSFSWLRLFFLLVLSVVVSYSFKTIYGVAANMSDLVDTRFSTYVTDNDQEFGGMNVLNYFENTLFLILAIVVRRRAMRKVPFYDMFLYMFVVYFGMLIVGNEIGIIKRLRDYYAIAYAFLCPSFIYLFRDIRPKRATYYLLVCYFVFLFFRSLAVYDSAFPPDTEGRMVPYHSIFSYSDTLF